MKRKYNKKKKGSALQKKTVNPTLDSFFKISNDNKYRNTTSTKKNPSPALKILKSAGKKLCIVRNPSKTHITEDSQQVLKKYHEKAQNIILCDFKIIDNLYNKLESSFDIGIFAKIILPKDAIILLLMLSDLIINSLKKDIILSSFGIIIFADS